MNLHKINWCLNTVLSLFCWVQIWHFENVKYSTPSKLGPSTRCFTSREFGISSEKKHQGKGDVAIVFASAILHIPLTGRSNWTKANATLLALSVNEPLPWTGRCASSLAHLTRSSSLYPPPAAPINHEFCKTCNVVSTPFVLFPIFYIAWNIEAFVWFILPYLIFTMLSHCLIHYPVIIFIILLRPSSLSDSSVNVTLLN